MKKKWQDPNYAEKVSEAASKGMLLMWQDPEWKENQVKAILKGNNVYPNNLEQSVFNFVDAIAPKEYALNVQGDKLTIGGKAPDIANVNGQKKVIECFGDYWHRGEDPNGRINYFKKFGWSTLIIWEHELENVDRLKNRIREFVRI